MKVRQRFGLPVLALVSFLVSTTASAAGFEKNIMWSGRHSGVGGTALSFVEGSEALYFNPAGLVSSRVGQDASLNVSIVQSKFEGPNPPTGTTTMESKDQTSTPFGLIYSATLNEKLAFGVGGYVSGGSTALYENVQIGAAPQKAELKTNIEIYEIAAGVGYQVAPGLKLGAAYRVGFATADFYTVTGSGLSTSNARLKDLKGENFAGFKLGAQYSPSKIWGLGLMVRTEYKFDLEGDRANTSLISGATGATESAKATAYFPLAVAFGGHWQPRENVWQINAEYIFTEYSKNGTLNVVSPTSGTLPIALKWKDQHSVRLGAEYMELALPIRIGYVWTSQVTPDENALPTVTAPGSANTVTVGTGYGFMENRWKINAGLEYTWVKGDGVAPAVPGEYKTNAWTLHTGLAYNF